MTIVDGLFYGLAALTVLLLVGGFCVRVWRIKSKAAAKLARECQCK